MTDLFLPNDVSLKQLTVIQIDISKRALVDKFYAGQGYKVKCGRGEKVFVCNHPEQGIIAAARLFPQLHGNYWLRNLVVHGELRNQGVGKYFISLLMQKNAPATCYCFALTHLKKFYLDLNFRHVAAAQAQQDIGRLHQKYCAIGRDWLLMAHYHS